MLHLTLFKKKKKKRHTQTLLYNRPDSVLLPQVWGALCVCGRWWRLWTASHPGALGHQLPERRRGGTPWSNVRGSTGRSSPLRPSSSVSCSTHTSTRVTKTYSRGGRGELQEAGGRKGSAGEGKEEKGNKPSGEDEREHDKTLSTGVKDRLEDWNTALRGGKLCNFLGII